MLVDNFNYLLKYYSNAIVSLYFYMCKMYIKKICSISKLRTKKKYFLNCKKNLKVYIKINIKERMYKFKISKIVYIYCYLKFVNL